MSKSNKSYSKTTLFKKTLPYIKREKWVVLLSLLLSIGVAVLTTISPLLTKRIIDEFIPDNNFDGILKYLILYFVLIIIVVIMRYFGQYFQTLTGMHIERRLREEAIRKIDYLPADMKRKYGYMARQLDLGGGYGVRYVESDPFLDVDTKVGEVAAAIHETCRRLGIEMPEIHMEPGRSIVADAGMTLYTAGTVKRIPGYKNYVSVDGGMPDCSRKQAS